MKEKQGQNGGQRRHQLGTNGHRGQAFSDVDGPIQLVKRAGTDCQRSGHKLPGNSFKRLPPGQQDGQCQNGSCKCQLLGREHFQGDPGGDEIETPYRHGEKHQSKMNGPHCQRKPCLRIPSGSITFLIRRTCSTLGAEVSGMDSVAINNSKPVASCTFSTVTPGWTDFNRIRLLSG